MRLIDADALYDKAEAWYKNAPTPYRKIYRSFVDIIADAPTISPTSNVTLTLDELLEMDGEPVWCVDGRGNQCWCLVNCDDGLPCCYDNETGLWEDCFYGMTGDGRFGLHQSGWLAYRRKPEEGTNAVT